MNWRWISLAALLAALVIGYGALMERGPLPATSAEPPPRPGYYLEDAVITQTQEDGSLGIRLVASRMEQQPTDDSIVMRAVRVNYFMAPGREWVLSARQGLVPSSSRVVHLKGDVNVRPAGAGPVSFLRTESLAIDTERNIAYSTSSPVRMMFGQHAMTVSSFEADLINEKLRLESVNGRFESL